MSGWDNGGGDQKQTGRNKYPFPSASTSDEPTMAPAGKGEVEKQSTKGCVGLTVMGCACDPVLRRCRKDHWRATKGRMASLGLE